MDGVNRNPYGPTLLDIPMERRDLLENQPLVDDADFQAEPEQTCREKFLNLIEKVKTFCKNVMDKWSFAKDSLKITASTLKIVVILSAIVKEVVEKINRVIAALGLASFVSMLVNYLSVPVKAKEMIDKAEIKDTEGAIRAGLDTAGSAAEVVSDMAGGVSALSAIGAVVAVPVLAAFSIIALPFAIAGLGYAVGKGIYDMVHHCVSLYGIHKQVKALTNLEIGSEEVVEGVKEFLNQKLKPTLTYVNGRYNLEFNNKKQLSILERRTDKKVVDVMKNLMQHLVNNPYDVDKAEEALKHMKGLMWRKIGINSMGLAGNIALLGGLIAVAAGAAPVSPIAIPVIAGVKAVLGIGKAALNMRLDKWHDDNVPSFDVRRGEEAGPIAEEDEAVVEQNEEDDAVFVDQNEDELILL